MAGNPFLRALLLQVRARGGWTPILERVAAGEALTKIAADYKCSRWSFYKLLHKSEKLWHLFEEARRQSAMALAEEGTDILDELAKPGAVATKEDIALARERVAQRRWLAQAYDRETFGVNVAGGEAGQVSIGALHLKVLLAPEKPRTIEAKVVEQLPSGQESNDDSSSR